MTRRIANLLLLGFVPGHWPTGISGEKGPRFFQPQRYLSS